MRKKMRKSPYKHPVSAHTRNRRPVQKYVRGKGNKPPQPVGRRRRVVGGSNPSEFDILVIYVGEPSERFSVDAKNYGGALRDGIEGRDKSLPPHKIRMRMVS